MDIYERKEKTWAPIPEKTEQVGKVVLDSAFTVHKALGPGLLETAYEACLAYEIRKNGLSAESQVALPVVYGDVQVEAGFRLDLLVDQCVIVEVKSVENLNRLHEAQLLTYLRLSGIRLDYFINFNTTMLKNGIKRLIL